MTTRKDIKKYVIDTSSLLVLLRHLLRLDRDGKLLKIIEELFTQGTVVLHAVVLEELHQKVADGAMAFLHDVPQVPIHNLTPARLQYVSDNWTNKERLPSDRKLLAYSLTADCQIIEHCRMKNKGSSMKYVVVSEELSYLKENSNVRPRPFQKIPDICTREGVQCMHLVEMLQEIGVRAKFWQGRKSDKSYRSQR